MSIIGECFCAKVKYRINGSLKDARSCHCSRCRKAFSSQASAYALVDDAEFEWLSGKDLLTSYIGEHGFGMQFCRQCGSTLCGVHHGKVHGVTLGCVNGDPKVELARHIYVGSKASWETISGDVVQYLENAPQID